MKKNKKFSAFKLFYDEFIYKEDKTLSNVSRNINVIRSEVLKVRNTSPIDLEHYMMILNRANGRIKNQLDEMYTFNPNIFDFYLMLYRTRLVDTKEVAKDMPFIISCSFYDDYRLDDKSYEELSNSDFVIPKYSSLEKKNIRLEAKKGSKLLFFLNIIKDSKDSYRFSRLIKKIEDMFHDLKPNGESHYDYIAKVESCISLYEYLFTRDLEKIKGTYLGIELKEKMEIVYHKIYTFDFEFLKDSIKKHFDMLYQEYMDNGNLIRNYMTGNSMSYDSYKDIVTTLIKEKNKALKDYISGSYENIVAYDTTDLSRFKSTLINAFFDKRYLNIYYGLNTEEEFARRAIDFYEVAEILETQLFEKITFDSSHSKNLGRNNDVNSAILEKIYYLYDPFELLERYEESRKEFGLLLNKKDASFVTKYNKILNGLKISKDYHGPLPTSADIELRLNERRKSFLYEKCITDLINYNRGEDYDTRNYDLDYFALGLTIDDLIEVYGKMKYKIQNYDFSSITYIDSSDLEKDYFLLRLQEFIADVIFRMNDYGDLTREQKENRLIDICFTYLKENCLFIESKGKMNRKDKKQIFDETYSKFYKTSSWSKLLDIYRIK